eukprot:TRINITY_DN4797_c0_g1_i6.p1 TRINITY_DN4797_c0_g1~~TRINITY_DN4797_c0_g1_i6.p1  ORF type:complete len:660 (+),score=174.99 TRINITY_DN4797_c0_g1_i6:102-2081(+)
MRQREQGSEKQTEDDDVLNPLWRELTFPDGKNHFYFSPFSGKLSLKRPSSAAFRGGILADEMGLGKTVEVISLILVDKAEAKSRDERQDPTLIVCPMSLITQWCDEIEMHVKQNRLSFCVFYGQERDAENVSRHDVVITTYGVLVSEFSSLQKSQSDRSSLLNKQWHRVILDEAHTIKSRTTQAAKACYNLNSTRFWAVTGTPVQNSVDDLYSLFRFLRVHPWCYYSIWSKNIGKPLSEKHDLRALSLVQTILHPILLRRTKDMRNRDGTPIVDLPEKDVSTIYLTMTSEEEDFYNALLQRSQTKFAAYVAEGTALANYASILELLLRLRQACDHPFLTLSRGDTDTYADLKKLLYRAQESSAEDGSGFSQNFVSQVEENIRTGQVQSEQCPVCLEIVEDAVMAPCLHTMCRLCAVGLFCAGRHSAAAAADATAACPVCRAQFARSALVTVPRANRFRVDVRKEWRSSTKVDALLAELVKCKEAGCKSIVFSQWTAMLDLVEVALEKAGASFLRFDGTLSLQARETVLHEFANADQPHCTLLISLKAGGVGLNLTSASHVFMLDPWWNPAVEEQAVNRVHRIGQEHKVVVRRFIVKNSVEEKMLLLQKKKVLVVENALLAPGTGTVDKEATRQAKLDELKLLFEMERKKPPQSQQQAHK